MRLKRAIVLHVEDNVATVTQHVDSGDTVIWTVEGKEDSLQVTDSIPFGHKVSLSSFSPKQQILKYGEVIGIAKQPIEKGALVHVHNASSLKGRTDTTIGEGHG